MIRGRLSTKLTSSECLETESDGCPGGLGGLPAAELQFCRHRELLGASENCHGRILRRLVLLNRQAILRDGRACKADVHSKLNLTCHPCQWPWYTQGVPKQLLLLMDPR